MKLKIKLILVVFAFTIIGNVFATTESDSSEYAAPVVTSSLNFSAVLDEFDVIATWDMYDDNLKYYKLVRSSTNDDPVYPEDGYIFYSTNPDDTTYTDKDIPYGTHYYRICAITNDNQRLVSPVITITRNAASVGTAISLSGSRDGGSVELTWNVTDDSKDGYKIIRSRISKEPVYPLENDTDVYEYITDPMARSYTDTEIQAGRTYYYRACIYSGSKCSTYSNTVEIAVPDNVITSGETSSLNIDSSPKTTTSGDGFSDVISTDWFNVYVEDFVEKGVIDGYPDGTFRPGSNVNRAEMAKIIAKFLPSDTKVWDSQIFCDVAPIAWFHDSVMMLYNNDIVGGYSDSECESGKLFKPSQALSRAEAIKIILLVFEVDVPTSVSASGFNDISTKDWSAPYVKKAKDLGITGGYSDGTFKPANSVNRAEFIKMISEAEEATQ